MLVPAAGGRECDPPLCSNTGRLVPLPSSPLDNDAWRGAARRGAGRGRARRDQLALRRNTEPLGLLSSSMLFPPASQTFPQPQGLAHLKDDQSWAAPFTLVILYRTAKAPVMKHPLRIPKASPPMVPNSGPPSTRPFYNIQRP